MKSLFKAFVITSLAAAVMLGTPTTSSAQDKANEKEKAKEKGKGDEKGKGGGGGFTGKAVAVDKVAKTVKLSGPAARVLQIVATTKITKDGKPATLDDVKDGDDVFGGYKITADGKLEATEFKIGKPVAKKKDEKKDEKKEEKK